MPYGSRQEANLFISFIVYLKLSKSVSLTDYAIDKPLHLLYIKHTFFSVWYPSGKGLVCKTIIGRFDSYPHLLKELPREVPFFSSLIERKIKI